MPLVRGGDKKTIAEPFSRMGRKSAQESPSRVDAALFFFAEIFLVDRFFEVRYTGTMSILSIHDVRGA